MRHILKTSFVLLALIFTVACYSQLTYEDYRLIKLYPAVNKQLVKPKKFSYRSSNGVTLSYQQSQGRSYEVKLDDGEIYTDGIADAWIIGTFKVSNKTYSLYGSYGAEGYLSGVLYDSNKKMFGLLEWQNEDSMTATLKTEKTTFSYLFTKSTIPVKTTSKQIVEKSPKPTNDALNELLKNGNRIEKTNDTLPVKFQEERGVGSGSGNGVSGNRKYKAELYLTDLHTIDTLSTLMQKKDKLKEWGWVVYRAIDNNGHNYMNIFHVADKDNEFRLRVEFANLSNVDTKMKFQYKVSNCKLKYVEGFVDDARKIGYKIVDDKKAFYKLQKENRLIIIKKAGIYNNEQYFTIEVK